VPKPPKKVNGHGHSLTKSLKNCILARRIRVCSVSFSLKNTQNTHEFGVNDTVLIKTVFMNTVPNKRTTMSEKPTVRFRTQPLVYIEILKAAGTPLEDNGIALLFMQWQVANKCVPIQNLWFNKGSIGGSYSVEDAEKIRAWLVEQGVEETA